MAARRRKEAKGGKDAGASSSGGGGGGRLEASMELPKDVTFWSALDRLILGVEYAVSRPGPYRDIYDGSVRYIYALAVAGFLFLVAWNVACFAGPDRVVRVLPVSADAPPHAFSEERALMHVHHLAGEIGTRLPGTKGLRDGMDYVHGYLRRLEETAKAKRPDLSVELDYAPTSGALDMPFLNRRITNAYDNVTNIVLRVSAAADKGSSSDGLLLNAHVDTTVGSPGASDCGVCVGVLLEAARVAITGLKPPPVPLVFLLNGAEETFMVAAHGFMKQHPFAEGLAAVINIESTGPSAPYFMFESRGEWPLQAYMSSALYPVATVIGQDIFKSGLLPMDTDFSVFATANGAGEKRLAGINIASILDGYAYHTDRDVPERIPPGQTQALGEDVVRLIQSFAQQLAMRKGDPVDQDEVDKQAVSFFEVAGALRVVYGVGSARIVHAGALIVALIEPLVGKRGDLRPRLEAIGMGVSAAARGLALAVLVPAAMGSVRAIGSDNPMIWYSQPAAAYVVFIPAALVGLLGPMRHQADPRVSARGAAIVFGVLGALQTIAGGLGGYVWAFPALVSTFCALVFSKDALVVPLAIISIPATINLYCLALLTQFVSEKVGMAGSAPPVLEFFGLHDAGFGAVVGLAVAMVGAPLVPWLAPRVRPRETSRVLFLFALIASAAMPLYSRPYTEDIAKRVVLAHVHDLDDGSAPARVTWAVCDMDGTSMSRVLEHMAGQGSHFAKLRRLEATGREWISLYPVQDMLHDNVILDGTPGLQVEPPTLGITGKEVREGGVVRVHVEVDTVVECLAAVVVRGPFVGWSITSTPVAEHDFGGPPYWVARHSGARSWRFWIDVKQAGSGDGDSVLELELTTAMVPEVLSNSALVAFDAEFPPWTTRMKFTAFRRALAVPLAA